jgi:cellulose synthase/poly-beta-1,6-N-acetylglucosamine synthase-like glycosyltransferase
MHTAVLVLAVITAIMYALLAIEVTAGSRSIGRLGSVSSEDLVHPPKLSVIVAARNEERHLETAVRSMLGQDYPDYEVIAVDDRSTDATPRILDGMALSGGRMRVLHIQSLPPGWLGKNHALHQGAAQATGSLLLFTDADIVMEPSALRRAVAWLENGALDHLAVSPRVVVPGVAANIFLAGFAYLFTLHVKPWRVRDPKSRHHIGIGAFNLVRASAYRAAGGHERIAMRPDDDMKLGKILKLSGFRQDLVLGTDLLRVEWYASFAEMIRGLTKNMFAGMEYNTTVAIAAVMAQLVFAVWPFAAVFLTSGATRLVNASAALLAMWLFWSNAVVVGIRRWLCITLPLGALMCSYALLRSMLVTLADGGIRWRDTHYPLDRLRANKI